jgi:hypothetical protein
MPFTSAIVAEMTMMLVSNIALIVTTLLAVKVSGAVSISRIAVPGEAAATDAGGGESGSSTLTPEN